MFYVVKNSPVNQIMWRVKASETILAGQLVKEDTGAHDVAADHTGATILGVALEGGEDGDIIPIAPAFGSVFEVDFLTTGTKVTMADTDLGLAYNIAVTSGNQKLDPDDTSDAFLWVVGYDNDRLRAFVKVEAADCLLA